MLINKIIDNHVHVGWYIDGYHTPHEVVTALNKVGIEEFAVSSTSTCAEQYKLIIREIKELRRLSKGKMHPILWITPRMLKTYGIRYMLHSHIKWEGVKMHWLAHPEWSHNNQLLNEGLKIVEKLQVPLLLHSGEQECCQPNLFGHICSKLYPLTVVIAHGRPIDQTIALLKEHPNAMVDTAFMPTTSIKRLTDVGLESRMIFGTDTPIQLVYNKEDLSSQIYSAINDIKSTVNQEIANDILSRCPYCKD